MQLTIIFGEQIVPFEVGHEMELENLVALIVMEVPALESVPRQRLSLMLNQRSIKLTPENLSKTLQAHSFSDQDVVYIVSTGQSTQPTQATTPAQNRPQASTAVPGNVQSQLNSLIGSLVSQIKVPQKKKQLTDAEIDAKYRIYTRGVYDRLKANPHSIRNFKLDLPQVANAFEEKPDDYEHFHAVYVATDKDNRRRAALIHDENSVDGQKFIEEQLRIEQIQAQHEYALEHMPEAFIPINLLHILVKINGVEVLAMIDSGAQSSIISAQIAKKCNIYDYVDERYFTKASGIGGLSKVKGRIHACKFQIGSDHVTVPIDVLDEQRVEILLGLNFLRPNSAVIDLKRNVLILGESTIPFLGEAEYKRELVRLGQAGIGISDLNKEEAMEQDKKIDSN